MHASGALKLFTEVGKMSVVGFSVYCFLKRVEGRDKFDFDR